MWLTGPEAPTNCKSEFVFSQRSCCVILEEVPGDWEGVKMFSLSILHFFKFKKSVNIFFISLMQQLFVMRLSVMQVLSSLQN